MYPPHYRLFPCLAVLIMAMALTACGGGRNSAGTGESGANSSVALTPSVTLSTTTAALATGQSTTLNWSSTNSSTCTAGGAWSGSQAMSGSQTVTAGTSGSLTYTLTCTGTNGGTATAATTLTASPAIWGVVSGAVKAGVAITLTEDIATPVSGAFRCTHCTNLAGLTITVNNSNIGSNPGNYYQLSTKVSTTSTAADGSYAFANVPSGNYTVTAALLGYGFSSSNNTGTVVNNGNVAGVNFVATALGSSGQVVDGYVSGATVTLDINDDHVCTAGEPTTSTDANGNYSFATALGQHMVCVSGGTDTGTGMAFVGQLLAPPSATEVTPLTSLVMAQLNIAIPPIPGTASPLTASTVLNAQTSVATQLGLSGIPLLHADPVVGETGLLQTTVTAQTLLVQITASIQAAGGGGIASAVSSTTRAIYADAAQALAATLASAPPGSALSSLVGPMASSAFTQASIDLAPTLPGLVSLSPASMAAFMSSTLQAVASIIANTSATALLTPGAGNPAAQAQTDVALPNTIAALAPLLLTSAASTTATPSTLATIAATSLTVNANGSITAGPATATLAAINNAGIILPTNEKTALTIALNNAN